MSNKPPFSRLTFLSALKDDRAKPQDIREERLRSTAGLRGSPAFALSAWRGRSGRRYVVGVHDLTVEVALDAMPAVLIAVRRDADGIAAIVDLASGLSDGEVREFFGRARAAQANELHVHRLAEGEAERVAVVRDLESALAAAAA